MGASLTIASDDCTATGGFVGRFPDTSGKLLGLALWCLCLSGCTADTAPAPPAEAVTSPSDATHAEEVPPVALRHALLPAREIPAGTTDLHHLLFVTDRILSGGEPKTAAAFAALQRLGVQVVVSVDGARPNVELARQYGLRYVHLPIGYDGVPESARRGLQQVVREFDGPIYIHCHHGRHRGPAAAAIACIASGAATGAEAQQVLERAGTGKNYAGLWRDVAAYVPVDDLQHTLELVEVADVDILAAAMAQIDRASDNLKLMAERNWQAPPEFPELVARTEATLLAEGFREAVRLLADDARYDDQFKAWLQESAETSSAFTLELGNDEARNLWKLLQSQCQQCHKAYRD